MLERVRNKKAMGCNAQTVLVMKATRVAALAVSRTCHLFEMLVIPFSALQHLCLKDHAL